jgi:hypothetical protein
MSRNPSRNPECPGSHKKETYNFRGVLQPSELVEGIRGKESLP